MERMAHILFPDPLYFLLILLIEMRLNGNDLVAIVDT